jgi:ABC-type phosphate transport system substrate-binding protein
MGIYDRASRSALTAICACSAVAGIGMMAAPGSALALEKCTNITGSGSSLQASQQATWEPIAKFPLCEAPLPKVKYTATGSGQGLKEFGMVGGKKGGILEPKEAGNKENKLDGFIGTDDPPTKELLEEAEKASGAKAEAMPIVEAPVAVIVHPPAGCIPTGAEFKVSNAVLNKLWLGEYANWKLFLTAVGVTFEEKTAKACEVAIKHEVRSDGSGTSFAFKNYLCQVEEAKEKCPKWKEFVSDAALWPAGTGALTEHEEGGKKVPNKGSGGEASAVKETAGSVGYVNLANAVEKEVKKYEAKGTKFWARVQNAQEPVSGTQGNCSTTETLTATQKKEVEENPSKWENVHLAKPTSTAYPVCTFTYDVGWSSYITATLEKAENYNGKGKEVKATAKGYFEYMAGEGQAHIAKDYTKLSTQVDTIAKTIAKRI